MCEPREVLELHGPWFKHPDGRFVDWSELPEGYKQRLRGGKPMRTPQQIIGDELYTQLIFEGYAVVPIRDEQAEPTANETALFGMFEPGADVERNRN